jgi:hypothetical protein
MIFQQISTRVSFWSQTRLARELEGARLVNSDRWRLSPLIPEREHTGDSSKSIGDIFKRHF